MSFFVPNNAHCVRRHCLTRGGWSRFLLNVIIVNAHHMSCTCMPAESAKPVHDYSKCALIKIVNNLLLCLTIHVYLNIGVCS